MTFSVFRALMLVTSVIKFFDTELLAKPFAGIASMAVYGDAARVLIQAAIDALE